MSLRLLVAAAAAAAAIAAGLLPTPFYTKQCMHCAMPYFGFDCCFFVASSVLFPHSCIGVVIIAIESVLWMRAFFSSCFNFYISTMEWIMLALGRHFFLCVCVSNFVFASIWAIKFICIERKMQVFILSTGCNRLAEPLAIGSTAWNHIEQINRNKSPKS